MPPRCTVLVVDDDTDIRESVRLLLEIEDYPVLEAQDGAIALQILLRSTMPLVVLVDYMMPQMNGLQLLREVTRTQRLAQRHTYVLVTANYDRLPHGDSEVLAALDVGRVKKPFDIDTLLDVVERACQSLARNRVVSTVFAP